MKVSLGGKDGKGRVSSGEGCLSGMAWVGPQMSLLEHFVGLSRGLGGTVDRWQGGL